MQLRGHAAAAAAESLQSCPSLCDPIDGSPTSSFIPGILLARTLEWVAISFSNAWKWKVKVKSLSHVWLLATPWTAAHQAPPSMGFSRQEYWIGVPSPSPWEAIAENEWQTVSSRRPGVLSVTCHVCCVSFQLLVWHLCFWWSQKTFGRKTSKHRQGEKWRWKQGEAVSVIYLISTVCWTRGQTIKQWSILTSLILTLLNINFDFLSLNWHCKWGQIIQ